MLLIMRRETIRRRHNQVTSAGKLFYCRIKFPLYREAVDQAVCYSSGCNVLLVLNIIKNNWPTVFFGFNPLFLPTLKLS
jgi:hypothetical protein